MTPLHDGNNLCCQFKMSMRSWNETDTRKTSLQLISASFWSASWCVTGDSPFLRGSHLHGRNAKSWPRWELSSNVWNLELQWNWRSGGWEKKKVSWAQFAPGLGLCWEDKEFWSFEGILVLETAGWCSELSNKWSVNKIVVKIGQVITKMYQYRDVFCVVHLIIRKSLIWGPRVNIQISLCVYKPSASLKSLSFCWKISISPIFWFERLCLCHVWLVPTLLAICTICRQFACFFWVKEWLVKT